MKYGIRIIHNGVTYNSDFTYKEEQYNALIKTIQSCTGGKVLTLCIYMLGQPVYFPKEVLLNSIITITTK